MANTIKLKRGSGSDPGASDLVIGEIAIRSDNGKLFTKKDNGTIAEISGSGGGGSDIFINTLSSSSGSGGGSASFNGSATRFTLSNPPDISAQQLIVSINGVIQKPNSGTSPSEGFAIDGTDIIFSAAPATGADFFIITYGSIGVSVPADNSVTSAKIVDGAIVNADINASAAIAGSKITPTFTSAISQSDSGGASNTFATNIQINTAYPSLSLNDNNSENDFQLQNQNGLFAIRDADAGGGTNRLTISSAGITTIAGNLDVGAVAQIGTSNDQGELRIGHDGSSYRARLVSNSSNSLEIDADGPERILMHGGVIYMKPLNSEISAGFVANGAVELYYDNVKKFETTSNGVAVTNIPNNQGLNLNGTGNNTGIKFMSTGNSPAHSYRVNFHSTTGGLFNSPCLSFDKTATNGDFSGHIAAISDDGFHLDDSKKLHLGGKVSSGDLQIYHNGSNSFILNATGEFQIANSGSGNAIFLQAKAGENAVKALANGAVELYYDSSKKFETVSSGISVTGEVRPTSHLVMNAADNQIIYLGAGNDLQIYHNGTDSYIEDAGTGALLIKSNTLYLTGTNAANDLASFVEGGAVSLFHNDSKKFSTTSQGAAIGQVSTIPTMSDFSCQIQAGNSGFIGNYHSGSNQQFIIGLNQYYDGGYKAPNNNVSQHLQLYNKKFNFLTAPAPGSDNGAVTNTKILTIDDDGVKFGTDTAAANALDDYEEGNWTPSGFTGGGSLTTAGAAYTKIGRVVYIYIYIYALDIPNNVNDFMINGLPFTVSSANDHYPPLSIGYTGAGNLPAEVRFLFQAGGNYIYSHTTAGNAARLNNSAMRSYLQNDALLMSGFYFV